jgi:glycine oxidase
VLELELAETHAGLRPGSPDNAPLLGPSALPGLIMATGHHRNGVLLTPVSADAVANYLSTGRIEDHVLPFSPVRFDTTGPGGRADATAGPGGRADATEPVL